MDNVYVIGHKNPDTDSIVSAMAYAALKNALGGDHYVAARYGHLNTETSFLLNRFGFQPPVYIRSVHTQVILIMIRLRQSVQAFPFPMHGALFIQMITVSRDCRLFMRTAVFLGWLLPEQWPKAT